MKRAVFLVQSLYYSYYYTTILKRNKVIQKSLFELIALVILKQSLHF